MSAVPDSLGSMPGELASMKGRLADIDRELAPLLAAARDLREKIAAVEEGSSASGDGAGRHRAER
jgi:hypothetical protein